MESNFIKIKKDDLSDILGAFSFSYRIIGPKVLSDTIILSDITGKDLPFNFKDTHGPGYYRLSAKKDDSLFSFSIGPDSFKRFLFPPEEEIFSWKYNKKGLSQEFSQSTSKPIFFFGLRACDIHALRLYDRIFQEHNGYKDIRNKSIFAAINCLAPNRNCFCSSISSGPEVKEADLIITELKDVLLIEIQNQGLMNFFRDTKIEKADEDDIKKKDFLLNHCRESFVKKLDIRLLNYLLKKLEHPLWDEIAEIDLECGNCTQVCPTCFCNSAYEKIKLYSISKSEIRGSRVRTWDSCFSRNFAKVHGGNFRPSRRARYRHWFMHKFFYMEEQFGLQDVLVVADV